MIVFGTVCGFPEKLATQCAPGIARSMAGEPWYEHHVLPSNGQELFDPYGNMIVHANMIFEDPCETDALVLLHDDLELRDPLFAKKVRAILSDNEVAVAGLIGSRGAKSLAWWEGERRGRVVDDYAGLHDFGFDDGCMVDGHMYCDVDSLDGMCLVLSPWACQFLRLGKGLGYEGFHGYADELCYQARKHGKRTVVADITAHHHSKGGYAGGIESWNAANENFRKRWFT